MVICYSSHRQYMYLPAHSLFWKIKLPPFRQLLVLICQSQDPVSWGSSASSSSLYHVLIHRDLEMDLEAPLWKFLKPLTQALWLACRPRHPWNGSLQWSPNVWGGKASLSCTFLWSDSLPFLRGLFYGICVLPLSLTKKQNQKPSSKVPSLRLLTS